MTTDELEARVRAWIEDDPEAIDREELERLLADGETAELQARFAGPLQFGTAGLRGAIGAGPGRMNRATVARATAGLCAHLLEALPDAQARGVTIGYDGRHRSRAFAEEAAAVAAGAGFRVQLFSAPVPTPVLAFALVELKAAGGVMVTASHNPKDDNGFKVYWHNGAQIIPPVDGAIAAAMEAVASIRGLPRVDEAARRERRLQDDLGEAMEQHYLDAVAELAAVEAAPPSIGVAYTAMHGVGQRFVEPALDALGYVELHSVPQQAEPDPDFPTAAFPNPEEEGAMDLVLALGEARGAALVLANDPDAARRA
ncbi:MAG: phospho-sugar mutase, partial [Myxococcales bacterium]|nr:phospho-sugar mutase [Myxococcales bacterium]